jgi:hypothetical protein
MMDRFGFADVWKSFHWTTYPAPSDEDRKGEPLLVIWLGKVRMASWNSEQNSWQEWPDGDFACSPSEVTAWGYPEDLLRD